jgi:hypothetical protein
LFNTCSTGFTDWVKNIGPDSAQSIHPWS